jgi:hypothetical protein
MKWSHVKAMIASSVRAFCNGSDAKTMCSFGIWNSAAVMVPVPMASAAETAMSSSVGTGQLLGFSLPPPVIHSVALRL